jgi:hypothetical protein
VGSLTDRVGAEHAVVLTLFSHEALCGRDRLKRDKQKERKREREREKKS